MTSQPSINHAAQAQDESTLLPLLYATDQEHGWSQGMHAITHVLLAGIRQINGPVLELGCGSGIFLREMSERNPAKPYFGIDRYGVALHYAHQQSAALHLTQADLSHLPFADDSFGLLVALDVFDQRAVDLPQALQESWRILRPGGRLLLRVSAYPWLQSAHDDAFNTGRRYARQAMVDRVQAAAFDLERVTYANTLMALPIIAQRLLQRWGLHRPWALACTPCLP